MGLNRQEAPKTESIKELDLLIATEQNLGSTQIYTINAGVEPILKLDFVFDGGLTAQKQKGIAIFTASMLSEGTKNKNSKTLADALDFYGAYFQVRCNADDSVATLYCLTKHLNNCLPIFLEALTESVIPNKELEIQKKNSVQKLKINLGKVSFLSRWHFYEHIFGHEHPYSVNQQVDDIKAIERENIVNFYNQSYINGLKYIMLSGRFESSTVELIRQALSTTAFSYNNIIHNHQIKTTPGKYFVEKTKAMQASIKIGINTINRSHTDYPKLQIFNLLFGGYFGSRLMKNIREDKGLTYGIYSVLETYQQAGVWYISTELNNELKEKGSEEIYKELDSCIKNGFSNEEIDAGKNYYLGSFLRGFDGVFSIADRNKVLIDSSLDKNYYKNFVSTLQNISNTDLIEVAQKHISTSQMVEVIAGSK